MNKARKEHVISCMNAAVDLYGVVTFDEMLKLYDQYAAERKGTVSTPLTVAEIDEILALPPPDDFDLEAPETWFSSVELDGVRYLVSTYGYSVENEDGSLELQEESVRNQLQDLVVPTLKILPDKAFFVYDDPKSFEETSVTKKVVKFLRQEYALTKLEAELAVGDLQEAIRMGPTMRTALITARNTVELEIYDRGEFDDLVGVLTPLVRNTRAWDYRGHTETELVRSGVLENFREIDGEDIFDWFMDDNAQLDLEDLADASGADGLEDDNADDWEEDAWDTGILSDKELAEILPPAEYPKGPVDFTFVKNAEKREQAVLDYEHVRAVTSDFVREVLVKKLSSDARKAAARRLGLPLEQSSGNILRNLDIVTGDFAIMLDDQFGEPLLKRVLKDEEKFSLYHRLGAAYFKNVHYAWLVVEAVKAGVGMKCSAIS